MPPKMTVTVHRKKVRQLLLFDVESKLAAFCIPLWILGLIVDGRS